MINTNEISYSNQEIFYKNFYNKFFSTLHNLNNLNNFEIEEYTQQIENQYRYCNYYLNNLTNEEIQASFNIENNFKEILRKIKNNTSLNKEDYKIYISYYLDFILSTGKILNKITQELKYKRILPSNIDEGTSQKIKYINFEIFFTDFFNYRDLMLENITLINSKSYLNKIRSILIFYQTFQTYLEQEDINNIENIIKEIKKQILEEEQINLNFKIYERTELTLSQQELYRSNINKIKNNLQDICNYIDNSFGEKNLIPKLLQVINIEEDKSLI